MDRQEKRQKIIKKMKSWRQERADDYKTYIKTSAVGLEFGLSIVIGITAGYFIDKYFKSSPYGLIIGVIIGSMAAVKRLYLFSKKYLAEKDEEDKDE